MKTTNWQTKALTLFIAATALWLTTACTKEYPFDYPYGGFQVTSSQPCEINVPLAPSQELVELAKRHMLSEDEITDVALERLPGYGSAMDERWERLKPEWLRITRALDESDDQIANHPYYIVAYVRQMDTMGQVVTFESTGILTDRLVAAVHLQHIVDLRTVPPEDRIPACIAGVPVIIVVDGSLQKENLPGSK